MAQHFLRLRPRAFATSHLRTLASSCPRGSSGGQLPTLQRSFTTFHACSGASSWSRPSILQPGRAAAGQQQFVPGFVHGGQRGFAKAGREIFLCSDCGAEQAKWTGQCSTCGEWNTLKAFRPQPTTTSPANRKIGARTAPPGGPSKSWQAGQSGEASHFRRLDEVNAEEGSRIQLASHELNCVFGGGLMAGSVVLVGGTPGVGKSTLMMQLASMLSRGSDKSPGLPVAYVSGEESAHQLKLRAARLGSESDNVSVLNETDLSAVIAQLTTHTASGEPPFQAVVVDSVQTMYLDDIPSAAGSVSQVKACAMQLLQLAKSTGITVFLVGHVTKSGDLAGPRVLEHLVDTVLYIEAERSHSHRLVRTAKNRFGSTSEVGVFDMEDGGLVEVEDPAALFLSSKPDDDVDGDHVGSAVAPTLEGSRPMCVEVQALATTTAFEFPRHRSSGIALDRIFMLLAVLRRHAGLKMRRKDLFVNIVGGLKIVDPGVDLATAVAIASSTQSIPVPRDIAFLGEVGLGGELRPVAHTPQRLATAAQLGFRKCIVPVQSHRDRRRDREAGSEPRTTSDGIETIACSNVGAALAAALR